MGWRIIHVRRNLVEPRSPGLAVATGEAGRWLSERREFLDRQGILERTPFLIAPDGRYDMVLHRFFDELSTQSAWNTQQAVASDLKCFFNFLWFNRAPVRQRGWRDASRQDRIAYKKWRLFDPKGPLNAHSSWDREVASANRFYSWAVREGHLGASPIATRSEVYRNHMGRRVSREVPRETSHRGQRNSVAWFTPTMYQSWRDVGLRGYLPDGRENRSFRGRWGSRDAAYTDLMIRTGLRNSEQASLSLYELPSRAKGVMNFRVLLPASIAKGGSSRAIYFPRSVLHDVWDYVEMERADAVEYARRHRLYDNVEDPLFIEDPGQPIVVVSPGVRRDVRALDHDQRRRLLIRKPEGFEPAALWLNQYGLPTRATTWESVFDRANGRCIRYGVGLRCHPHLLRHSMAVITLEQLWRGHLEVLGAQTELQRRTYQMVYGDPLRWVQMRLGHARLSSTLRYQHTLHELEMETRMALIPDAFEGLATHADDFGNDGIEETDT